MRRIRDYADSLKVEAAPPLAVMTIGNLGIAGHRDSFFRGLKDVAIGDVWVLAPTDLATITLVTCYFFYYVGHAPKRFIVKATAEHSVAN